MHLTVYEQGEIFYFAFVFGVALGLWYDVFRMLRHLGLNSRRAFIVQDILFMTSCGILCFIFASLTVNGHLRLFVLAGHIFGFMSYRFSFGMLTGMLFKGIEKPVTALRKLCGKISRGLSERSEDTRSKLSDFMVNMSHKEK